MACCVAPVHVPTLLSAVANISFPAINACMGDVYVDNETITKIKHHAVEFYINDQLVCKNKQHYTFNPAVGKWNCNLWQEIIECDDKKGKLSKKVNNHEAMLAYICKHGKHTAHDGIHQHWGFREMTNIKYELRVPGCSDKITLFIEKLPCTKQAPTAAPFYQVIKTQQNTWSVLKYDHHLISVLVVGK